MKKNKKLIRIGTYLVILGLIGLVFPFLSIAFVNRQDFSQEIGEMLDGHQVSSSSYSGDNHLIIEKSGIDMPLFFGDNEGLLSRGGWVYSGNSTPDKDGNTVIFGHRFQYLPPMRNTMFNLDKLSIGDQFEIKWESLTYKYQVFETKVIEPTDLSVLNDSDFPMVTLITCTPKFSTKQRLIVKAFLISQ